MTAALVISVALNILLSALLALRAMHEPAAVEPTWYPPTPPRLPNPERLPGGTGVVPPARSGCTCRGATS